MSDEGEHGELSTDNSQSCTIAVVSDSSFILLYLLLKGMSYAETGGGAGGDDLIDLFGHE